MEKRRLVALMLLFIILGSSPAQAANVWPGKFPSIDDDEYNLSMSFNAILTEEEENICNGDPCGVVASWKNSLVLPEWKSDRTRHEMSFAEGIALAAQENDGNFLTLLVFLDFSERVITGGARSWNVDREFRMLQIANYGSRQANGWRWRGLWAQLIGFTYQNWLEENDGLLFPQAFRKYTGGQESWREFRERYAYYARLMNYLLGTHYFRYPSSYGYYHHFRVTDKNRARVIVAIQRFLEATRSPLKDKKMFQKKGTSTIIRYDEPWRFCK